MPRTVQALGTPEFQDILRKEIEGLGIDRLPLQAGLSGTSYALDNDLRATIIRVSESATGVTVKAGIFYAGIIAGCSCADDPTPVEEQTEYCEVRLDIDRRTGEAEVTLL